jgi:hypothetical protein
VWVFGCVECDVYGGVVYAYIFWVLELWMLRGVRWCGYCGVYEVVVILWCGIRFLLYVDVTYILCVWLGVLSVCGVSL